MPLTPSTRLGPYEILAAIGAGGMGEVYRARDTRLDRTVAIKILPEHLSSNPQLRERFDSLNWNDGVAGTEFAGPSSRGRQYGLPSPPSSRKSSPILSSNFESFRAAAFARARRR